MKKIIPLLIFGFLILSSIGAAGFLVDNDIKIKNTEYIDSVNFENSLKSSKENGYMSIYQDGTNSYISESGKPKLPFYIKTYEFPKNTKITDVECQFSSIDEIQISDKIIPAAKTFPISYEYINYDSLIEEDNNIYSKDVMYPGEWYTYSIRCGLNSKGLLTTFLTIEIYPIQYEPLKNKITYTNEFDIKINYQEPEEIVTETIDSPDLVIIAPELFSNLIQPLINHKIEHNMPTVLKTTEEIYNEYEGRDKPEKIKHYILDAKETWNNTYVLLFGGLNSYFYAIDKEDVNQGSEDWYVPVRYTNIRGTSGSDEYGTPSDLYYSDLYRYNTESGEWEFEDWDSNGNNVFAEWAGFSTARDQLDLVPDVYVGRLACRNENEVETVVNKIINYESTSPDEKPWYKKMVGIGGLTFSLEEGQPDGEFCCDASFDNMGDLIEEQVRVYASNKDADGPVPIPKDITSVLSEGAGYVNFEGHGFTAGWNTNWPEIGPGEEHNWTGGIKLHDYLNIKNGDKLPVVIVGGCHNGLFNVTMIKAFFAKMRGHPHFYHASSYPTPECFSWRLVAKPNGGAIASTGCTGYGIGGSEAITLSSELEINFFYEIGQEGLQNLGSAHGQSIAKYISENSIKKTETHCIVIYELFGDPSLRLGGYP